MSRRFDPSALSQWTAGVLQVSGIPSSQASVAAAVLCRTSLRGIDTHGVSRIPAYVQKIIAGEISGRDPEATWREGVLHVDGRAALGQVVASVAMEAVIRATAGRAAAVGHIVCSGHLSALGLYALQAAEQGRLALICQRTPPIMGLAGSRAASMGNNPLAFAAPVKGGAPLVFDMANSVVARGHILQAARDGAAIPAEWALGPSGEPTTDAAQALRGYLQPMAGHKGLGLAMMVEVLASGLGGWPADAPQQDQPVGSAAGVSAFLCVINPALFCGQEVFEDGMNLWLQRFLGASGVDARYPGQRQAACEIERRATGVPLPASVVRELCEAGQRVGCPFDLVAL
jgi:LDH2 family malate/lactate/ureidoglycolate dehydrogenase